MGMKFIRGMIYPNANNAFLGGSSGAGTAWRFKWAYEFWGFCVNGTASTTVPGGFAANNGVVMPVNFTGGTGLMASGTDGYHPVVTGDLFSGDCVFTAQSSSPFTASMVGKALVMWKPNSDSSEDSIYLITQVLSSTQIMININTGGIPNPTTKHPSMTSRTGVNYRVVDMVTGTPIASMNGSYLVFQTDASSINPGQANSQFQLVHLGATQGAYYGVTLSGTGSWNGAASTITAASNATPIVITTSLAHSLVTGQTVTINGVTGNTAANGNWVITVTGTNTFSLTTTTNIFGFNGLTSVPSTGNGAYVSGGTVYNGFQTDGYTGLYVVDPNTNQAYSGGQTAITMIADKTFFINHIREQDIFQTNVQSNWHFEIPKRLYPQGQDLHPMAMLFNVANSALVTNQTTYSYGGGFVMRTHSSDVVTARSYRTLVKAMRGDGTPDVFGQNLSDYRVGYNTIEGTIPASDAILCLPSISNQYSLARVRLRTVKFTGTHVPKHHRIGLNGEFIQMQNGICWPWDNTIIPFQLLVFGV